MAWELQEKKQTGSICKKGSEGLTGKGPRATTNRVGSDGGGIRIRAGESKTSNHPEETYKLRESRIKRQGSIRSAEKGISPSDRTCGGTTTVPREVQSGS